MKEKEMLRLAFANQEVPHGATYCFIDNCPMKDECIHHLSYECLADSVTKARTVLPSALREGNCSSFAPLRIVRKAWGFDNLFTEVKVKDAPVLRERMRDCLGSSGQYYRYKLGQLRLMPDQQEAILRIFSDMGYTDVSFDNYTDEIDFSQL